MKRKTVKSPFLALRRSLLCHRRRASDVQVRCFRTNSSPYQSKCLP